MSQEQITLRDYQNEAIQQIKALWEKGVKKVLLWAPTGSGKGVILSTLLLPDRGKVEVLGIDGLQDGHRIRERVNISSGNANFLWSLTVKENLHFYGMLYGLVGKKREEKVET
jgi:ABC-type Na+ transport system ATPase subunit NatA